MAESAKKTAAPAKKAAAKRTRTVLTPQQRIDAAQAKVDELKAQAKVRATKQADKLLERRATVAKRVAADNQTIASIDAELIELGFADEVAKVSGVATDDQLAEAAGIEDVPLPEL